MSEVQQFPTHVSSQIPALFFLITGPVFTPRPANSALSVAAWNDCTLITKQILLQFARGVNPNALDVTSASLSVSHWPIVVGSRGAQGWEG